jgi:signal transduction histidine kinase
MPLRRSLDMSLRRRFLLVIVLGAVLPLALVGWWLTRTAVRSGEAQLRGQLDSSLSAIASRVEQRWVVRRGELSLLADNEVARRTLGRRQSSGERGTAADSEFMRQLFGAVERAMPRIRYLSSDGSEVWSFGAPTQAASSDTLTQAPIPPSEDEGMFSVRLPVRGLAADSIRQIGELRARIRLATVLPTEESQRVVGRAVLSVTDRASGATVTPSHGVTTDWVQVHRRLDQPPLDLDLAAPAEAYVRPFEHAARLGLIALLAAAAFVIALSFYLTGRLTSSLEQLVEATTAVAHGDLQRNVPAEGDGEVARLAHAFNSMTESLRGTLEQLAHQRALAAIGEFAATLAHEVRNALTAVRVDLQRAEERADDQKSKELMGRALHNVRRLDLIVTGSLRVAKGGGGQTTNQLVDLRRVLSAAASAVEPTFATANATLESCCGDFNGDEGPLWVNGDPSALEQLFLNLLLNAGQAVSSGGSARIDVEEIEESHVVMIRDTGGGISPERAARLREPFFSSKNGGTGLGLTIARRIAAAHGGEISLESQAGKGTTARVRLPRSSADGLRPPLRPASPD